MGGSSFAYIPCLERQRSSKRGTFSLTCERCAVPTIVTSVVAGRYVYTSGKLFSGQNPDDRVKADNGIGKPAGTYYKRDSSVDCRFWHCLDQVLLRPALLPFWNDEKLGIITQIDATPLVTSDGIPDKKNISDHLPLLFSLAL